jgi:hypothetical protein
VTRTSDDREELADALLSGLTPPALYDYAARLTRHVLADADLLSAAGGDGPTVAWLLGDVWHAAAVAHGARQS